MGVPELPVVSSGIFKVMKVFEVDFFHVSGEITVVGDHEIFRSADGEDLRNRSG